MINQKSWLSQVFRHVAFFLADCCFTLRCICLVYSRPVSLISFHQCPPLTLFILVLAR